MNDMTPITHKSLPLVGRVTLRMQCRVGVMW